MDIFCCEIWKNLWSGFFSRSSDGMKSGFWPVFWPWVSQIFAVGNFYGLPIVNTSCTTYVPNLVFLAKLEVWLLTRHAKTWYPHSGHFGMRETEKNLKARGLKIINHVDVAGLRFVMGSRTYGYTFHTFVIRGSIFEPQKTSNFVGFFQNVMFYLGFLPIFCEWSGGWPSWCHHKL